MTNTQTKARQDVPDIEFTPPTGGAVVVAEPVAPPALAPATETDTMLGIVERAARDPRVDIDKLERLIKMQERIQERNGQVEYDNAMSDAQAAMKAIRTNLENTQTRSEYADYSALDKAVRPIYAKHGFSLSFSTGNGAPENCVRIVCTVAHRGGHREMPQLDMPTDGKGARGNDVMTKTHATGAAITYGKRYLLGMIFNLAVTRDDDGNGAGNGDWVDEAEKDGLIKNGERRSTYDVQKAKEAAQWADEAIQYLNACNAMQAQDWRREKQAVPKGKRQSDLEWLQKASPGQYLRVQQCYQNVTGEDLE